MNWFWLSFLLVAIIVLMIALAVLEAWLETRSTPKEPMYICEKHGPISKKHIIRFPQYEVEQVNPTTGKRSQVIKDIEYCSICFHTSMTKMEKS